jgi:UDP-N-acetylglucosamine--N-acetylmuramyl-(pentapeptide) pyrophosphoryl-undecaprenol N-acetylglucosamine transferase
LNILIAAGGTGGHIFPAIALGEALREQHPQVRFDYLCGERELERSLYESNGITPIVLPARQMGAGLTGKLRGGMAAAANARRAAALIRREGFDAVVGMGGYVSGPAVLAGWFLRRPTAVHEANSVPGKTNRWLAPWVDLCAVNFPSTVARLRARKTLRVGMPIRRTACMGERAEGARAFGLDPSRRTLLVIGGSQGARFLYEALVESLDALDVPEHRGLQILWSTGAGNFDMLQSRLRGIALSHISVRLERFISRMDLALAAADLAVARAGASTIAELVSCGIGALYIPYPHAIYDHQTVNAREIAAAGCGDMVPEKNLTPDIFAQKIASLLVPVKPGVRFAPPPEFDSRDAAHLLANALCSLASVGRRSAASRPGG